MKRMIGMKFDYNITTKINKINKMFDKISMDDYSIGFELQQSYFLRDCLEEEISYELKDSNIIIHKKSYIGISEEISLEELIFYIHTDVAEHLKSSGSTRPGGGRANSRETFYRLFRNIDTIKKAVENMKIILKYDDCDESDKYENDSENDSENDDCDEDFIMKMIVCGTLSEKHNILNGNEKNKDHESLAF